MRECPEQQRVPESDVRRGCAGWIEGENWWGKSVRGAGVSQGGVRCEEGKRRGGGVQHVRDVYAGSGTGLRLKRDEVWGERAA